MRGFVSAVGDGPDVVGSCVPRRRGLRHGGFQLSVLLWVSWAGNTQSAFMLFFTVHLYNVGVLRPKDICIHLDAAEEHGTNVASLPASYRMMSG